MNGPVVETLCERLLPALPETVRRPAYARSGLKRGIAHIGVGAFHRCHQAEYTDDLLTGGFDDRGIVGINVREPRLDGTLGRQDGLYTRLCREDDDVEARVIGSILSVVDSQQDAGPALSVLASPDIDVVTLTITEKGYCHRPASGELDPGHPDIVHDLANPERPRSVPGILARMLEMRMQSHGRPVTILSCDNIPANGVLLGNVVRALAERRPAGLAGWLESHAAFPSAMVDRIAPATTGADLDFVEKNFGYRDRAAVVGEPFRQWVIENRFASSVPAWERVGATFVDAVEPYEHLKMRVLNGAQTSLCYLGVFTGLEYTCDDMADPLLAGFVRRMLLEETLPTLRPVPGIVVEDYVEQSLKRLRNRAIRHRNHQIATDGSQKIVQRLVNPIRDRLRENRGVPLLATALAGWMAYLVAASSRFGKRWQADDPYAGTVAAIADRIGDDPPALVDAILSLDSIFPEELSGNERLRALLAQRLAGLLGPDPRGFIRRILDEDHVRS